MGPVCDNSVRTSLKDLLQQNKYQWLLRHRTLWLWGGFCFTSDSFCLTLMRRECSGGR
ncbi:hypothetical protein BRAS3843_2730049 [Bradyrhizobium sp. STM 3843]|nr:hypothetical protein BRAS3843_2730049 [Bradyrhizobium sp. STM 3843]